MAKPGPIRYGQSGGVMWYKLCHRDLPCGWAVKFLKNGLYRHPQNVWHTRIRTLSFAFSMRKIRSCWWKDAKAIKMGWRPSVSDNGSCPWQPNKGVQSERNAYEGVHSTVRKKQIYPVFNGSHRPSWCYQNSRKNQSPPGSLWDRRGSQQPSVAPTSLRTSPHSTHCFP